MLRVMANLGYVRLCLKTKQNDSKTAFHHRRNWLHFQLLAAHEHIQQERCAQMTLLTSEMSDLMAFMECHLVETPTTTKRNTGGVD